MTQDSDSEDFRRADRLEEPAHEIPHIRIT